MAREHAQEGEHEYTDKLKRIQTVIIDISTAISRYSDKNKKPIPPNYTKELEDWIHEYSKELPPPEQYIIPVSTIVNLNLTTMLTLNFRAEVLQLLPYTQQGLSVVKLNVSLFL